MLGSLRAAAAALPKGMSADTMRDVPAAVRSAQAGALGLRGGRRGRRLPCDRAALPRAPRRHRGLERRPRYGAGGRPELEYRLRA